jgi:two-component system cell cycle sensor histidine kinase/response regulator CckA
MRETETLLVVDGQNDTLSVPIMLSRQGFNVIRSNCASEALRLFAELPELDVDLLVVDLVLPEMNGVDLVHHVRKLRPELPVLYVTGRRELQEPPAPSIARPFTAKGLATKIRQVLDQPNPPV